MKTQNLFLKVLNNEMESCNGGTQTWQLNKKVSVKGKIEMCQNGIHLTLKPTQWKGTRVFIAETKKVYAFQQDEMKAVCRTAKLLLELSPSQLKTYEEGRAQLLKTYEEGRAQLLKTYEEGRAQLWKTYEEGRAQLLKTYEEGRAQLLKTYEEGEAPLWKTYEEGEAQLLKTYKEGKAPLLKTYEEGRAPLWKTYEEGCQKILHTFLSQLTAQGFHGSF